MMFRKYASALAIAAFLTLGQAAAHDLADFGGVCDGLTDNTPALNAAIAAALASPSDKVINIPTGRCMMLSKPSPLSGGVSIVGQGKSNSVLVRAYSGDVLTITGNGTNIRDLTIFAEPGTHGNFGIHMIANEAVGAGGNHTIENVWVTGNGGTYGSAIFADGAGKTTAPAGIRTIFMKDVTAFNSTFWSVNWWNCIACEWYGGGVYQGFGTMQGIAVGGGTQASRIDANIPMATSTIWPGALR